MPVYQKWHYVCPVTGAEVVQDNASLPERWGELVRDYYSPEGLFIVAKRILTHSDAEYNHILTKPYPDDVLDDWRNPPPVDPGDDPPADDPGEDPEVP